MFDFIIINTPDGNQVIDRNHGTPYSALSPVQMEEYVEMDVMLYIMDRMGRRAKKEAGCERKPGMGLLRKLACLCGLA